MQRAHLIEKILPVAERGFALEEELPAWSPTLKQNQFNEEEILKKQKEMKKKRVIFSKEKESQVEILKPVSLG